MNSGNQGNQTLYCSFCGKSEHEVRKLIAGPSAFICNECVVLCFEDLLLEGERVRVSLTPEEESRELLDEMKKFFGVDSDFAVMRKVLTIVRSGRRHLSHEKGGASTPEEKAGAKTDRIE